MQISEMQMSDIEKRLAEISEAMNTPEADLDALTNEVNELEERKNTLKAEIEQRKAQMEAITVGTEPTEKINITEERKTMDLMEIRNSNEYALAFLNAIKSGDETECRALLTDQVSGGQIPVPTFLENEIKTAWEECKIMSLVKTSSYKGNVKIGFEVSATGAEIHVEGTNAPTEETIVLGSVELKAENIKKWITVSDEALEGTTVDTMGYLYKEIAQKIVEKAEEIAIGKITSAPTTTSATAVGVPQYKATTLGADTIVMAEALLSGKAKNLHIAMNRQTYASLVSVALASNYAVDVFDGLKDRIVFTDVLPSFSSASASDVYMIIGDFGYGFQANKPNGDSIKITVDNLSLAEKDLVKIVGRQYVGMGVVAPRAFVNIVK